MAEPTPSTELAQIERPASTAVMTPEQYDSTSRMAKALAHSGTFKDIGKDDWSKALARILLGADLGMSPTQALMGIDIVKGNPQIRGVALGRMVRQSAKRPTATGESYDYAVLDRGFEPGAEYAVVALYRRDEDGQWPRVEDEAGETFPTAVGPVTIAQGKKLPAFVEAFKLDQALKRKLVKTDSAWESQPEVMCVWRALSQIVRFEAPDVIGGMPVYTEADGLRAQTIGAGQGSGEGPGWGEMPLETVRLVMDVIERAKTLGHAGLSDTATIQQRLNGQTAEVVARWLTEQTAVLDGMPPEAEVVPDAVEAFVNGPDVSDEERAADLERQALDLMADSDSADAAGDEETARMLSDRASDLHDQAQAIRGGQTSMDIG